MFCFELLIPRATTAKNYVFNKTRTYTGWKLQIVAIFKIPILTTNLKTVLESWVNGLQKWLQVIWPRAKSWPLYWVLAQHGVLYTRRNKGISLSTTLHNNHDDNPFKLDCGDHVCIGLATGLTNISKHNFYYQVFVSIIVREYWYLKDRDNLKFPPCMLTVFCSLKL